MSTKRDPHYWRDQRAESVKRLDALILAYRAEPSEPNRSALLSAQSEHITIASRAQIEEMTERA